MRNNWMKLNSEELELVTAVYTKGGTIFVDRDGILHTGDGGNFGVVKSEWFRSLDIFTYEVENEKIIQILRTSNGARNINP